MTTDWAPRLRGAHQARLAAVTADEQTIRDAARAGYPLTEIAAALGIVNRRGLYAITRRTAHADQIAPPEAIPTVYLRGAGRPQGTWTRIERALWVRGWRTTHDRTAAWHLARGGAPVVICDFSGTVGGSSYPHPLVGRVAARYADSGHGTQETRLLLTSGGRVWVGHPIDEQELAVRVGAALDGTLDHPVDDIDRVV